MESTAADILLGERDLLELERSHPDGLTAAQIIRIFQARGARLSEATFRKYIQLGLLPRSRRVGVKGKHRGSHGLYPSGTVRRVNLIKRLLSQSFTIAEIQQSFTSFKTQVEEIEAALEALCQGFEREITAPRFDHARRRSLARDVGLAKRAVGDLVRRLVLIESQITWPERPRSPAAGGAIES